MSRDSGLGVDDLRDNNPPYYLVQRPPWSGRNHGPFSTYLDACTAQAIAKRSWVGAEIMNKDRFEEYLTEAAGKMLSG